MRPTAETMLALSERNSELQRFADNTRALIRAAPCCMATGALIEAAELVAKRAAAWERIVDWAYQSLATDVYERTDRLHSMKHHPHQFTADELLAERNDIGKSELWCRKNAGSPDRRAAA